MKSAHEPRTAGDAAGRPGGSPPRALVVVGTRPEAIKMMPVLRALRARADEVEPVLVLTGQHDELVRGVLDLVDERPDHDLALMRPGQDLYDVAHGCLDGLRRVVRETGPASLLVQGDTASVCFGALVGFFERVRVGHVEAGLRSHDRDHPWPEEIFRRLTDVLADDWFAPTAVARDNLVAEGVPADRVRVVGNPVVDALREIADRPGGFEDPALASAAGRGRRLVLLTAHRRESFGEPLRRVLRAVRSLADAEPDVEVVYPVHPNPNVRAAAEETLRGHPRIHLTEPVGYADLVRALDRAALVLTDSGGIQEEAPTFGTPVLVLRETTERPEAVDAGVAELVGTDPGRLLSRARARLAGERPSPGANPFGDGLAGERIADVTIAALTGAERRTTDWTGPAA